MNLEQTKDIFIRWVKSCDTQEQLDLLKEIVDDFVTNRFVDSDFTDKLNALAHIDISIREQDKIITILQTHKQESKDVV